MVTLAQVQNLQAARAARTRLDPNDAVSVAKAVARLGKDVVLFHDDPTVPGKEKEGFCLALMPEFGRRMLAALGGAGRLLFLDSVWGMTTYGYPLLTLVVRDEWGHHCPAATCISDSETAKVVGRFLSAALEAAKLDPAECVFMIDKSTAEIAAIKALGARYLLCKFHFLQEADRWMKTAESGVAGKTASDLRSAVVHRLIRLQFLRDKASFEAASAAFRRWLVSNKAEKVEAWYAANWEVDAEHWAGTWYCCSSIFSY